ncbi:MAG TPA: N-methyl-L-tryptophan oxidase [Candidatus Limnocylindrales bacterium]|nr:N-methyl-L-tryptophan oxidase [Candidatus Limnocylindrales bacterium]
MSGSARRDRLHGTRWDVVVVGLGGIGSAAACWLARAARPGLRVLGLDRYEPGHRHGASEDVSRIIRLSYHRREYVRLAQRAYDSWAAIERDANEQIVRRTGGLDLGPAEPRAGVAIDLREYAASLAAEGISFERLDAPEIRRRWPVWRIGDDTVGLYQADAGIADPSRGNAAHRSLASAGGATLRFGAAVQRIDAIANGTALRLALEDGQRLESGSVILATDSWTNELLEPLGQTLPLTITEEHVSWFLPARAPERFGPDRFPVWIWMDEPSFYGFPTHAAPGPKVGQDVGGRVVTHATRTFRPDAAAEQRMADFLDARLPDLGPAGGGRVATSRTCLYTLTPDRDFVLDRVPGLPSTYLCLGSAHAYKFASVLGRILAELVLDGTTPSASELSGFAIDRPALREPSGAPTFVI